jgi:signal transduction histidine kinase
VIEATTRDLRTSLQVVRESARDPRRLVEAAYELASDVDTLQALNTWRVNGASPRLTHVVLTELLPRVADRLRSVVWEREQNLVLTLSDVPAPVEADETRLELVIASLLLEALSGAEPGARIDVALEVNDEEITVRIAATPPHRLWKEQPWVSVAPADADGVGDAASANGLDLAQELVQPAGGRIRHTRRPPGEGGHVFTLTLPRTGRAGRQGAA